MEIQRNLGLELRVTRGHGVPQFHKRIGFPTIYGDPEKFRIRIEVQGDPRGLPPSPRAFITSTSCEKFRNRIEVQGVAPHEMDFL